MMYKILNDVRRTQKTNDLFSSALKALEAGQFHQCLNICAEIMYLSDSIEQRLAVMTLQGLANSKDLNITKEYLEAAYKYETN